MLMIRILQMMWYIKIIFLHLFIFNISLIFLFFELDNLEYGRYLKEVVEVLETDPEFKKKIENASLDDIQVFKNTVFFSLF